MLKIGTDIVEIKRIEASIERFGEKFKARFLSHREQAEAKNISSIAGLWAAKEAISKALGCGIGADLSFLDIEISKDSRGAPHIKLSVEAQKRFMVLASSLSISHDGGFAIAVVAIEVDIS